MALSAGAASSRSPARSAYANPSGRAVHHAAVAGAHLRTATVEDRFGGVRRAPLMFAQRGDGLARRCRAARSAEPLEVSPKDVVGVERAAASRSGWSTGCEPSRCHRSRNPAGDPSTAVRTPGSATGCRAPGGTRTAPPARPRSASPRMPPTTRCLAVVIEAAYSGLREAFLQVNWYLRWASGHAFSQVACHIRRHFTVRGPPVPRPDQREHPTDWTN